IWAVRSCITGANPFQDIGIGPVSVYVVHQDSMAHFFGPMFRSLEYSGAGVGMPAPGRSRSEIASVGTVVPHPMDVVSDRFDVIKSIRIEMFSGLSLVSGTLDHMVKMGYYAGCNKGVTVLIEVDTPWIARSTGKNLKYFFGRMIPPYPGIERNAVFLSGTRFTYHGMGEYSLITVQPTIGAPRQAVERFVGIVEPPAIQQDFRFTGGSRSALVDGDIQQIRCRADPDSPQPQFYSTHQIESFHENGSTIERTIPVGIVKYQNAIFSLSLRSSDWISVR